MTAGRIARLPLGCVLTLVLGLAAPAAGARGVGTDLASLNLCLYGDCEARGTYAADRYGLYNPAVMTVGTLALVPRGVILSGSYFHLDIDDVDADFEAGVVTVVWDPVAFQVATAYAEADGPVGALPGVEMHFRTRAIRLAAGVDAERAFGLRGLSLGLAGVVPSMTSDLRLEAGGVTLARSTERRQVEIIPGIHWRTGARDWFMVGAFLDATRNAVSSTTFDPATGAPLRRAGTLDTWIARAGASALPFVPFGLADGGTPRAEWLGGVRLGIDVEYRNLGVPGEGSTAGTTASFGADVLLLPDALNPLAGWIRPWVLGGVDTRGGWGVGAGLYGRGPLQFLGCNPTYSSRPLTDFIGDRVDAIAVTCGMMVPL